MKLRKIIIIAFIVIGVVVVFYNSVYFEKLDAKRQKELVKNFKPRELVDYFWKNKLNDILQHALEIKVFDSLLKANPELLITKYGRNVGISANYSFLVKGKLKVSGVKTDDIDSESIGYANYHIPCKFIFSNTARDAVGFFKMDDFANSIDFNAVSSELNAKIIEEVIHKTVSSIRAGCLLDFTGALEINKETLSKELNIIPFRIQVTHDE